MHPSLFFAIYSETTFSIDESQLSMQLMFQLIEISRNRYFRGIVIFEESSFSRNRYFREIVIFRESIMTSDESWYYTIYGDIWYKSGYSCFLKCEFVNSPNLRRSPKWGQISLRVKFQPWMGISLNSFTLHDNVVMTSLLRHQWLSSST